MSESSVGLMDPATRQNSGTCAIAWPSGGVNGPAGTICATVTVVFGGFSFARSAQLAANREDPAEHIRTAKAVHKDRMEISSSECTAHLPGPASSTGF